MNLSGKRPLKPPKPSQGDPTSRPAVPLPLPKPKKTADTRQSYAYEDTEPTKPRVGTKPLHAKVILNSFTGHNTLGPVPEHIERACAIYCFCFNCI